MADEILQRILGDGGDGPDHDAYAALILEQAKKVIRSGIPHPEGRTWVGEDAWELVSEFYLAPAYNYAVATAADDDQLHALVYTSLRNQIAGELRKTERARLRRRMKEIMVGEGYIEEPAKFWRQPAGPEDAFGGRRADLVEAAWEVQVRLVRWRADAKRNSPVAERQSFVDVLEVIFGRADGSVHEDDLLDVVASRFGVGPVTFAEALDVPEEEHGPVDTAPTPEAVVVADDEELEAAIEASSIWTQLSPEERLLLPHLGKSVREAGPAAGMGKTKANTAMPRLEEKLNLLIDRDESRRRTVIQELLHLARGSDS